MNIRPLRARIAAGLVAVAALGAAHAPAASAETVTMAMTGDPLTGSLAFRQDLAEVNAGDVIRFTNLNDIATHAPTERSGLWGLTVAPRTFAERTMEAGTHLIVCRLHPDLMQATIRVSPLVSVTRRTVRRKDRRGRLRSRRVVRTAQVRWATTAPAAGQAYDVERRRRGGDWTGLRSATSDTGASFTVAPGERWQVRARLRAGDKAGGWSPSVAVVF